jgi:hypothetical protein
LNVIFLFASGQSGRLRVRSLGELSEGFAMTEREGSGGAFVIVRRGGGWSRRRPRRVTNVGCRDELTSASSIPVPAGISKSGTLPD